MTALLGAAFGLLLSGIFIQLARRLGWGKSVRGAGPRSHLGKEGTPTMGGIAVLVAAIAVWLLRSPDPAAELPTVLLVVASAGIGLADDLLALGRKRRAARGEDATTGLLARYRLLAQGAVGLAYGGWAVAAGHSLLGVPWLDVLAYSIVVVSAVNALNFSDGLDGLAGGMSVIMLVPFLASPWATALLGALLGFLWYNAHPARVFMGGVGSEALGAALAGLAIRQGAVWYLPLLALVPVLEVLSVIVQVGYFRATGGRRLLRMSPLHHHFELSGWPETRVVLRFWLVTAATTALTVSLLTGRS